VLTESEARLAYSSPGKVAESDAAALTKAEMADILFDQVGLNKRESKEMVDAFFDELRACLVRGEMVKLSGFGNFQLRDKPSRPGRNPKTGESIPISARRVVTFHASQKLKAVVQDPAAGGQLGGGAGGSGSNSADSL
jgi:integration host factor subunit alpha